MKKLLMFAAVACFVVTCCDTTDYLTGVDRIANSRPVQRVAEFFVAVQYESEQKRNDEFNKRLAYEVVRANAATTEP